MIAVPQLLPYSHIDSLHLCRCLQEPASVSNRFDDLRSTEGGVPSGERYVPNTVVRNLRHSKSSSIYRFNNVSASGRSIKHRGQ